MKPTVYTQGTIQVIIYTHEDEMTWRACSTGIRTQYHPVKGATMLPTPLTRLAILIATSYLFFFISMTEQPMCCAVFCIAIQELCMTKTLNIVNWNVFLRFIKNSGCFELWFKLASQTLSQKLVLNSSTFIPSQHLSLVIPWSFTTESRLSWMLGL